MDVKTGPVFVHHRPRPLFPALLCGLIFGLVLAGRTAPINDNFADAIALTGSTLTNGSNVAATFETGEPTHAGKPGGKSVWWTWTATHNSSVTISTAGSDFDTLLAIYTGTSLTSLSIVATNDDSSFVDTTSLVTFNAVGGTTYRVAVDGIMLEEVETEEGNIRLCILDNDGFADRTLLSGASVAINGHNSSATSEPGEPQHASLQPSHSIWWSWTAPGNGAVQLRLTGQNTSDQGGDFYKRLAVYTGTALNTLTMVADDGHTFVLTNELDFDVTAGTTYQIAADGVANATGRLRLEVNFTGAPINDLFADRILVNGVNSTVTGSNVGARKEPTEPNHAGNAGGHSVWWTWTAPGDGSLTLSLSGGLQAKLLAVYAGNAVGSLTPLASNLSAADTNQVSLEVMANQQFQIAVDGVNGQVGSIMLNLAFRMGGSNDQFADRIVLSGANLVVTGSNLGASAEPLEPYHGGYAPTGSVWWTWTAPANGMVTLRVFGDNLSVGGGPFYKLLGAYTGSALGALTTNKLSSGLVLTNRIIFDVVGGTPYQLAVDGYNGAQGTFELALGFVMAPPNDDFDARIPLNGSVTVTTGSNVAATKQPGEPNHATPGGRSVWWTWTAPEAGNVTIATAGSTFNTTLAVYRGAAVDSLTLVIANNDLSGSMTSQVAFGAEAGTTYQIAVDGYLGETGSINLSLSQLGKWSMIMPHFGGDGTFQFSFIGQANSSYVIDASTNLINWTPAATLVNTTGQSYFVDPDASMFSRRFYRARLQ